VIAVRAGVKALNEVSEPYAARRMNAGVQQAWPDVGSTRLQESKFMPQIVFLPHHEVCPEGAVIEAEKG
jgi:hypothetical protein